VAARDLPTASSKGLCEMKSHQACVQGQFFKIKTKIKSLIQYLPKAPVLQSYHV